MVALHAPASHALHRLPAVRLPLDERPHVAALEWWHFMVHLTAPIPRTVVVSLLKGGAGLMSGICALVIRIDHARRAHDVTTRVRPTALASTSADGFELVIGDVTATGALGVYRLSAPGLVLDLVQATPATLFGDRGVMTYPGGSELGYYAYTQLAVRGVVDRAAVAGTGWMEHQWGNARIADYRWRYLAAQLASGERIAAFAITHVRTGRARSYGIHVDASGAARELVEVSVGEHRVRARGIELEVMPCFDDQRCRSWLPMLPTFWEGACRVTGTIERRHVAGPAIWEVVS